MRPCSVEKCNRKHYAIGFCKNHYERNRRKGTPEYTFPHVDHCLVEGCLNKGKFIRGYCGFHYSRYITGVPLNAPNLSREHMLQEKNPNWNGGTSEYPNHSEMKRIRKLKIKDFGGRCVLCGIMPKKIMIHHIDLSKDNHSYDNLLACCPKCAGKFHRGRINKAKIKKTYGYSLKELSEKFGGGPRKYYELHRKSQLTDFLWRHDINAPFYPLEQSRPISEEIQAAP